MMEGTHMPEATLHDGSTIEIEVHGSGPTLLLPVNPQPVTGPLAEQMRQYGTDPALGQSLIKGLSDAFRVVAFDYEGQCLRLPKPETLTPANAARDLLAVANAAGADRFAYYGYSWLALLGLQLAIRTDRLWALIMGGFPPLNGPYEEMRLVTTATYEMASGARAMPSADESEWSGMALSRDQTRKFVTLYQALQGFDNRAAQAQSTCPRLCFVGSADEIQCDQALDFWNQTGKIECILLCRHYRLKDETDERSRIKCGRDLRPHHPCGVRSVTSRRIRLSSCWQDLRGSTFATPAWL